MLNRIMYYVVELINKWKAVIGVRVSPHSIHKILFSFLCLLLKILHPQHGYTVFPQRRVVFVFCSRFIGNYIKSVILNFLNKISELGCAS